MEADGTMEKYKKKNQATLRREMRKIRRNLEGVRELHGLPGALIIVDPRREEITVREAARMNVPVLSILDTDCDPDHADILIPGNDDAMSSVQLLLSRLADAVIEGRASVDEAALVSAQRSAAEDIRSREAPGRRMETRPGGGRPRSRTPQAGGRLGRRSTGRFADRRGGHADSVSIGEGQDKADSKDIQEAEAKAAEGAAKEGPAGGAPAKEGPGAEAAGTEVSAKESPAKVGAETPPQDAAPQETKAAPEEPKAAPEEPKAAPEEPKAGDAPDKTDS